MTHLSPGAQERLEAWCERVRRELADHEEVDADDVIADLREHVERSLAGHAVASVDDLEAVLVRLGDPAEWLVSSTSTASRQSASSHGTDAAVSAAAALTAAAAVVVEPLLMALAYVLARYRTGRGPVGRAERWLAYPPIVLGAGGAAALLLLLPFGLAVAFGAPGGFVDFFPQVQSTLGDEDNPLYWARILSVAGLAAAGWWLAVAGVLSRRPDWVQWLFRPLVIPPPERMTAWLRRAALVSGITALAGLLLLT